MKLIAESRNRLKIVLNVIVLALCLYAVSRSENGLKKTSAFENVMIDSFAPMQSSVSYVHDKVSSVFEYYLMNIRASKENRMLRHKIYKLEERVFGLEELDSENIRLKKLLQFGEEIPRKKVLAQIVAWDASSDNKVIRINKGMKSGIELQSPVVTSKGVVGYVYRLTDNYADILTILDPNNRVDTIIRRTRSHGILEGFKNDRCLMKYVTRTEPIIINDEVITSGLGNIYPKGLRVGQVTRIERESYGITQHIEVIPSVDFSGLEEVIVLISKEFKQRRMELNALDEVEGVGDLPL